MEVTQEQANIIKKYVQDLPSEKKGEFIKRYKSLDEGKKQVLISRIVGSGNGESSGGEEKSSLLGNVLELAPAIGLAGGAAAGIGMGINAYKKPFIQEKNITNQLYDIQKQAGFPADIEPKTIPEDTSKLLSEKISSVKRMEKGYGVSGRENFLRKVTNLYDQRISSLESEVLNPAVSKTAESLKAYYPEFRNKINDIYSNGLGEIDSVITKTGGGLNRNELVENVLSKTSRSLQERGIKSNVLDRAISSLKIDNKRPMSFRDLKSIMVGILKSEKNNIVIDSLRNNLDEFIDSSKNIPKEAKKIYSELNQKTKPMFELRNTLEGMSKTKTGTFDYKGITTAINKYVNSGIDSGIGNIRRLLTEDLQNAFSNINKITADKKMLIQNKAAAIQRINTNIAEVKSSINSEIDRLSMLKQKSAELTSRLSKTRSDATRRNPLKLFGLGRGVLGGALKTIAPISVIPQAIEYAEDPQAFMYRMYTGQQLPPKGTLERKIATGEVL